MSYSRNLRWGLLLKTILLGSIIGLAGGYAGEFFLNRYGIELPFHWLFPLFGLALGIVTAFGCFLIARRNILAYVRSLQNSLSGLEEDSPSLRDQADADDQARSLYQRVENKISALHKDRERLAELFNETNELLESDKLSPESKLQSVQETVDARFQQLERLQAEAQELNQWYEANLEPLFTDEWPVSHDGNLDSFDEMVRFHAELEEQLQELFNELQQGFEVFEPWEKGPTRIRSEIERANQLLLRMAELFREFPDEKLPELAESLRKQTQSWDDLADQIEQGIGQLQTVSNEVMESLESLRQRTCDSAPPKSTREELRVATERFDEKVDDLQQAVEGNWAEQVNKQFRSLQREAERLSEAVRVQKESLKDQQNQVEIINSMFKKWRRVLNSDSATEDRIKKDDESF